MQKISTFLLLIVLTLLTSCTTEATTQSEFPTPNTVESVQPAPTANCPVTVPQIPAFVPPPPYDSLNSFVDHFWYGSNSLWTILPENGVWDYLPHNPTGYTQKILWWREGYVWDQEPEPNLIVTGERLDESAPPLVPSKATNAYASDIESAMLVGVDFPTHGCWKITGRYNNVELSFVIWVAP